MSTRILDPGIKPPYWPIQMAVVDPRWWALRNSVIFETAMMEHAEEPHETITGERGVFNSVPSWIPQTRFGAGLFFDGTADRVK